MSAVTPQHQPSITSPAGFTASGVAAGLKASGALDIALVANHGPRFDAAGVFTTNRIQAAPVVWTRQVLKSGKLTAVVLNSGGANACTGPGGFADTHQTAEHVAELLTCGAGEVAVCSTGLIGERLPMGKLLAGVSSAAAALTADGGAAAAHAIMTTDSVSKQALAAGTDKTGVGFLVAGMAKGAGMLAPGLATMLCVITTDAAVESSVLQDSLRAACRLTFDRIDSDGCMSTNDTVLLLASGASGAIPDPETFAVALRQVCSSLARQLIADAEGADHEIAVEVVNAATEDDAVVVARAVTRSNLFKCAVTGQDPNWGRVLASVGTTSANFEPDQLGVAINGVWVATNGAAAADRSLVDMSGRQVHVVVDLHAGSASATVWSNDLTAAYVHENSVYST